MVAVPTLRLSLCAAGVCLLLVGAGCAGEESGSGASGSGSATDGAASTTGDRTSGAPDQSGAPAGVRFVDATEGSGLEEFRHRTGAFGEKWTPETMGGGVGVLDYDGDGDLDVLLVGGGALPGRSEPDVPALRLYENRGDGTFTDRTRAAGLADLRAYGMGVTAGDYDGDGDPDVFLTALNGNRLLRNDGDGTFTEVTERAGLAGGDRWSTAAAFFDADGDGDLDLYVGNYVRWSPRLDRDCTLGEDIAAYCNPRVYEGAEARFFRNEGDGTFTERTAASGFSGDPGKTLGVVTLDYDEDGRTDLAVANDERPNLLYRNEGDGTFTEIGRTAGIAFADDGSTRAGMGIDAGVIDSTRRVSIAVGNFTDEMIGLMSYEGAGLFGHRSRRARIGFPSLRKLTFGLFFFDADLDGDLDLFVANGHLQEEIGRVRDDVSYRQVAQLFRNRGGRFEAVGAEAAPVLADSLAARGATYGDLDGDGDPDVLLVENGGGIHLWENRAADAPNGPHYLAVRAAREGAIPTPGTRVTLWTEGRPISRTVRGGGSYLSLLPTTLTFGLGSARTADSARVRWASGEVTEIGRIPAGRTIDVRPSGPAEVP